MLINTAVNTLEDIAFPETLLKMLKRASRDSSRVLKLAVNGQLFRLLEIFANQKNP